MITERQGKEMEGEERGKEVEPVWRRKDGRRKGYGIWHVSNFCSEMTLHAL